MLRELQEKAKIDWQRIFALIINYTWLSLKYLFNFIIWLLLLVLSIIKKLGSYIYELFVIAINYKNKRKEIINRWQTNLYQTRTNLSNLPLITKILTIAGVILIIVIISTIYYLGKQRKQEQVVNNFNTTIEQIKAKRDTAESYLIFDEENKAFKEIKEASVTLSTLNCTELKMTDTCDKIKSDLDLIMNKVRKMYTVETKLLTDWGKNTETTNKLVFINKNIFNFTNKSAEINIYDLLSKNKSNKDTQTGLSGYKTANAPKENDYAIFIGSENELVNYDPTDGGWKKENITYPNNNVNIKSAFVYNRRLYLLDASNNQIYRHDPTTNGFGKGAEWIDDNSGIDFGKANSLAIDGDVFVINTDGKIYKFTAGQKQDYSLQNIDPQLTNVDDMWTYFEMQYLYILDGTNKRLIIINKTDGTLKKQLTAKEFVKPTGMVIDEPNGTAYILDDGKLYQIDLNL